MSDDTISKKDCMDYKKVESFATSKGCEIVYGGKHAKIKHNNNTMAYPRKTMGYGLACSIYKWFKLVGLLCMLITIGAILCQIM